MAQARKLNREVVVREAIALLNADGLDAVTLRAIAARLGVRAPSLARHVGDKAHLLSLVSSTILAEALSTIPTGLQGDAWLEAYGQALRDKQRETRDISGLLATTPPNEQNDRATSALLFSLMHSAGLQGPRALMEITAIQALVTGWMTFEKSRRAATFATRFPDDDAFRHSLRALIAGFRSE